MYRRFQVLPTFIADLITKYFYPDQLYASIYDIDFTKLYESGIKGLILDIDNTLVAHGEKKPDGRTAVLLDKLRDIGFQVCILSNSTRRRVARFSAGLGIYAAAGARKPASAGFIKAARLMDLELSQICMIGDQIFTDIFGAKRLGIKAIFTNRISDREIFTVALKRIPEKYILWRFHKNSKSG